MDFDLEFSSEKSGEHKDHSQSKSSAAIGGGGDGILPAADDALLFDNSNNGTKVSTSSDDFEHIVKDNYDDFLTKSIPSADVPTAPVNIASSNLIDDYDTKPLPKIGGNTMNDFDDFLTGSSKPSTKDATMDFMAAERHHDSPVKTAKPSIYDEIETDYLNPYASKSNEKFISSEDLLGDFKDDDLSASPVGTIADDFAHDLMAAHQTSVSPPKPIKPEVVIKSEPIIEPPPKAAAPVVISKPVIEETPTKVEEIKSAPLAKPTQSAAVVSAPKPKEQMISAEEMFYRIGLGK